MRLRRAFPFGLACAAAITVIALGSGVSQAVRDGGAHPARSSASPRTLTWAKFRAMTPAEQAAVQNPLLRVVTPVQNAGTMSFSKLYWGTALDVPRHAIDLYVTDPSQAGRLIAAAKRLDPALDTGLILVRRAAYSAATLTAAGNRVLAASDTRKLPFAVYAVAQVDLGASLQIQVANAAKARALSEIPLKSLHGRSVAQLAGVRLTFRAIGPSKPLTRENDVIPFIGGDYMTGYNANEGDVTCTAGIAVEDSGDYDYLITANHCFTEGYYVTTENGNTIVGIPDKYSTPADAELVYTGYSGGKGSNADEGESDTSGGGIHWFPLTGTDPSWTVNESFCQDGIESYLDGRGVPCDMVATGLVTDNVCGANGACHNVVEIETVNGNSKPPATPGDSGAVVFTLHGSADRYAAGMIDYGKDCTGPQGSCYTVDFVWAPSIYSALGVHLNPHT